ncbi:MAG: ATP-binding protein [Bacteroidales bacterium]|nr:ATP-binding protein [Bacteroidales bacterium]
MDEQVSYRERISDQMLKDQLEAAGAVLVQGPKWCGKTTTAKQHAASVLNMDHPKMSKEYLTMAENDPELLLDGEVPRLLDEWQMAPQLWDTARYVIDQRGEPGQFIFTGSAVPADKSKISHTGTGRFAWLTMRTMSLWESGESNGKVSLLDLFAGQMKACVAPDSSLEEIAYMLCRGGWPGVLGRKREPALRMAANYVKAICESDISRVDDVQRDPDFAMRLLRAYARHQGGQVPVSTIHADLVANGGSSLTENTIALYLSALKKIFVIEDMPAWNPNLRSKTAIRTSDTRYFVDPSVATAALGLGPKDLMKDLTTYGLLFETMAVRDLRVYADAIGGRVYHYRDHNGLECDTVIHLPNGHYGLAEVKLGGETLIEEGAANLKKLAGKIDTTKMESPSFMMIVTATGSYAYQRKDGVIVVPIGCLKN